MRKNGRDPRDARNHRRTHRRYPSKTREVFWVVLSALLPLSIVFGGAFVLRTPRARPHAVVSDPQAQTVTIPIEGMSCASCVARVKQTLHALEGVTAAEVSLAPRNARVSYLAAHVSPERLVAAITDLGYTAGPPMTERTQ